MKNARSRQKSPLKMLIKMNVDNSVRKKKNSGFLSVGLHVLLRIS